MKCSNRCDAGVQLKSCLNVVWSVVQRHQAVNIFLRTSIQRQQYAY